MTTASSSTAPEKTLRLQAFAHFFKSYMSVSAIVAASIPIPITSWKLIPIYAQQRSFLTVYASLLCFLILAFVFSLRHQLSVWMFSRSKFRPLLAALPFLFIIMTVASIVAYHAVLQESFRPMRERGVMLPASQLLSQTDFSEIPYALILSVAYLSIFIFAELAFVLMAIREYLQDQLHLDEAQLLRGAAGLSAVLPMDGEDRRAQIQSSAGR